MIQSLGVPPPPSLPLPLPIAFPTLALQSPRGSFYRASTSKLHHGNGVSCCLWRLCGTRLHSSVILRHLRTWIGVRVYVPAPLTRTVRSQRVVCFRLRASRARTRPNDLLAQDLLQSKYMLATHCMKCSIIFSPGVLHIPFHQSKSSNVWHILPTNKSNFRGRATRFEYKTGLE
jgi:hypothetical protein